MSEPSLERAVELLSRAGSAEFERDIGGALTVAISRVFGAHLTGTADRMRVVGGMELAGRGVRPFTRLTYRGTLDPTPAAPLVASFDTLPLALREGTPATYVVREYGRHHAGE